MTKLEAIKQRVIECMKSGEILERDTLKTVIGEAQKINLKPTDENILQVLKKSKTNCIETMKLVDESRWGTMAQEVIIYDKFLPSLLSTEEITSILKDVFGQIVVAKSDGQATGIAMGYLRKNGHAVDGKDVSQVVSNLRSKE